VRNVALAGRAAAIIKLADRLDNLSDDWSTYPADFLRLYVRETGLALTAFGHHHPALALDVGRAAMALVVVAGISE
jgi:hypothetical protein